MAVKQGEIYWASLDPVFGREMGGWKDRPVLVVSIEDVNDRTQLVIVVPGTKVKDGHRDHPNSVTVDPQRDLKPARCLSIATSFQCHQIRAIAQGRLTPKPTGLISNEKCLELLKHSMFMVMPSEWYEGFPMTIREALACGKPVIASRMGAMAELINDGGTGLLFETGNSDDLVSKVRWLVDHKDTAIIMGKSARLEFESKYTAEKNYDILMEIYKKATDIHKLSGQNEQKEKDHE